MRVGIDASNIRGGGGITHVAELLKHFVPEKHPEIEAVFVFGGFQTLKNLNETDVVKLVEVPILNDGVGSRILWQLFVSSRVFLTHKIDVLFSLAGVYTGSFKPFVGMSQNMLFYDKREIDRYSWSIGISRLRYLKWMQNICFKKASKIIFISKYAQEYICNINPEFHHKKALIHHGIHSRFKAQPKKQLDIHSYKNNPFRILYVSSVTKYKHQWVLIEAVSRLRGKGFPVILDVVGAALDSRSKRLMLKAIRKFDPDKTSIKYYNEVPHNQIESFYHNADLFAFSSSCENMPNILIEAMASGLPIASSNHDPMPEFLEDAGLYYDPESVTETEKAIEKLLVDPALRAELASKAYKYAEKYNWEACSEATFKLLSELIKK